MCTEYITLHFFLQNSEKIVSYPSDVVKTMKKNWITCPLVPVTMIKVVSSLKSIINGLDKVWSKFFPSLIVLLLSHKWIPYLDQFIQSMRVIVIRKKKIGRIQIFTIIFILRFKRKLCFIKKNALKTKLQVIMWHYILELLDTVCYIYLLLISLSLLYIFVQLFSYSCKNGLD